LSDGQLLDQFLGRTGNAAEVAFAALVKLHGPMVWGVCRGALIDIHDAEDAFQATFLVLVRKANSVRNRDTLGPWLYGVARRIAVRAGTARRRRREQRGSGLEAMTMPDPLGREEVETIHQEVDRLPEKYRTVIVLCYLEGRTHTEAARLLGCPVGTVNVRASRAREILRDRLTRRGLALPAAFVGAILAPSSASAATAVPVALAASTVKAALGIAAGMSLAAGSVSARVAQLAQGVLKTMTLTKLAIVSLCMVTVGLASAQIGWVAAESPLTLQDVSKKVQAAESGLLSQGYQVSYEVTRKVIRKDEALQQVQVPGSDAIPPSNYFRSVVTRKGDWTYEILSASEPSIPLEKDSKAQVRIYSGKYGWMYQPTFKTVNFGRDDNVPKMKQVLVPYEDIYSEVIGLQSASEEIYPTFRGLKDKDRVFSLAGALKKGGYKFAKSSEQVLEGVKCVVLESEGLDRVWLAAEHGYALAKREWYWGKGKGLKAVIQNSAFRKISGDDLWLPTNSHVEYHGVSSSLDGNVCMTAEIAVKNLTSPVDDSEFVPDIKPGIEVWEFGGKMWHMPAKTGESLDRIIANSSEYTDLKPEPRNSNWKLLIGANVLLIIIIAFAVFIRHKVRKNKAAA
jgi:RNA polymerase sigma factor (sigma-70 family)